VRFQGAAPKDRFTWFLEVVPIFIGVPILVATRRGFPLTPLLYGLILVHAAILAVGGKYTYAEVPAGFWFQHLMGWARNPYDRLGHLAQGFVPAILAREIYLRNAIVKKGAWTFFLVCCTCLAFSACYEFFEWWTAVAQGSAADAFLGTQGDVWDTQWDMFMALVGSIAAQLLLARWHDRQIAGLAKARKKIR
jgi:putative membrane protein